VRSDNVGELHETAERLALCACAQLRELGYSSAQILEAERGYGIDTPPRSRAPAQTVGSPAEFARNEREAVYLAQCLAALATSTSSTADTRAQLNEAQRAFIVAGALRDERRDQSNRNANSARRPRQARLTASQQEFDELLQSLGSRGEVIAALAKKYSVGQRTVRARFPKKNGTQRR
jgi:hypothetical protein